MSSPATVIDAGSELGSHRGGFSAMDFDSLMAVDMGRLTVLTVRGGSARGALLRDHETRDSPPPDFGRFSQRPQIGPLL